MDLKQAIFALLALVVSTHGFPHPRQMRQRQRPRGRSISFQHSITRNGHNQGPRGLRNNINQRTRVRNPSNNPKAVNIIANIVLQYGQNNNRGHAPNRNSGHGPVRNQGGHGSGANQGLGHPQQPGHGHINQGGNAGHGTGILPNSAQGYNHLPGLGQSGLSSQTGTAQSYRPRTIQSILASLLAQRNGGLEGRGLAGRGLAGRGLAGQGLAGQGLGRRGSLGLSNAAIDQLIANLANNLKQNQAHHQPNSTNAGQFKNVKELSSVGNSASNSSIASGTISPLSSHIVILPSGPNAQTLVLSHNSEVGLKPITTKNGQGAFLITQGGTGATSQQQGKGFHTITTLKPGEDPPEIEHM